MYATLFSNFVHIREIALIYPVLGEVGVQTVYADEDDSIFSSLSHNVLQPGGEKKYPPILESGGIIINEKVG